MWIARYLADVRPKLAVEPDDGILFLTVDGTGFSPYRLTGLVADYVKRSGVGKPGASICPAPTATLMLEGGADIRFIQQMLGHADISTTQIYTQVSLRQLRAIHAATHPAASNTPRRQRLTASDAPLRPVAAFETEVLHLTLATEVRQENAHLDTDANVAALADDISGHPARLTPSPALEVTSRPKSPPFLSWFPCPRTMPARAGPAPA